MSKSVNNYRKMTTENLKALLEEFKFNITLASAKMGRVKMSRKSLLEKMEGTAAIKNLRKETARVKTILAERERLEVKK